MGRLRRTDLPAVAHAIVARITHQATDWRLVIEDQDMVRVYREDGRVGVYVRGEDWAKIQPYLADGSFSPQLFPAGQAGEASIPADVAVLDTARGSLYDRVYGTLCRLFPDDYPTSTY